MLYLSHPGYLVPGDDSGIARGSTSANIACDDSLVLPVLYQEHVEAVAREAQQTDGHHIRYGAQILEHEGVPVTARNRDHSLHTQSDPARHQPVATPTTSETIIERIGSDVPANFSSAALL